MTEQDYHALEFHKILDLCAHFALSEDAKAQISAIRPEQSFTLAEQSLALTNTANQLSVKSGNPSFYALQSPDTILKRAVKGARLSIPEILQMAVILKAGRTLRHWYDKAATEQTPLQALFFALMPLPELEKEIARCIVSDEEIADNASPTLSEIRRSIRLANQKARDILERYTKSSAYQKYLQDQIITIRNGRFVLPVRAEHKAEIKGLVHDTSASGSTLFIEPMTVVEQNNKMKELELEEQREIDRILDTLSAEIASYSDILSSNYSVSIELEVLFAKSKLGDSMRALAPALIAEGETNLRQARHPLIAKELVVPIDIMVGGDFDTLVITGPNTGGKTVALKTIGLLTLMACSGFLLPVGSRSQVCYYNQVLADIGDEQSIEQNLSTFSGQIKHIVTMLQQAAPQTLVLIDELGAGTDPVEGAALAVAIIAQLRQQGAKIIATTHYAEIKLYALQTPGIQNASCEFDMQTLRPTYRLLIGTPGRSNAFAISEHLGLSQQVIAHAQELISSEDKRFEDAVSGLEYTRQQLEEERKQAQQLRQQAATVKKSAEAETKALEEQQEKIITQAEQRAKSILEQVRFQADQILNELDELKKQKDKEGFAIQFQQSQLKIKQQLRQMEDTANPVRPKKQEEYKLPRALKRGDIVYLMDFNTEGTVLSPADSTGNVRVRAGIIETKAHIGAIRLLEKSNHKVTVNGGKVRTKRVKDTADTNAVGTVDVRGMDSEEATMEVAYAIDRAVLSGLKFLHIIHGKGTGVLRSKVQQQLQRHSQIKTYRLGGYGEGGDGVTIAELP